MTKPLFCGKNNVMTMAITCVITSCMHASNKDV